QTFGCGSAVATSSMVTELVKGMTLDDALTVTRSDVADALDGLPPIKMHCSNLAADALHDAIKNWREGVKLDPVNPDDVPEKSCTTIVQGPVEGEADYEGKGLYKARPDPSEVEGLRVLVVDTGEKSLQLAMDLTEVTGRVVFMTTDTELPGDDSLRSRAKRSDVKLLFLSKLLEVGGEGEVEKVKVHDLDEDEEYELFIDSLIIMD
ncbi:MAG: iron-sulfur cluster assembly scaffold protein, partial [Thermoplasmata archaeon]